MGGNGGNGRQWEAMGGNEGQWEAMGGNGGQWEATGGNGRQRGAMGGNGGNTKHEGRQQPAHQGAPAGATGTAETEVPRPALTPPKHKETGKNPIAAGQLFGE